MANRAVIPLKWLKAWKAYVGYASPGEDPATVAADGPSPGQMNLDKLVKVRGAHTAWRGMVAVPLAYTALRHS